MLLLAAEFPIQCHWDGDGRDSPVCVVTECGRITTCGKFGWICGGYDTKGSGDEIVFSYMMPAGPEFTYYVTLDFIKIDHWFESLAVSPNPAV